MFEIDLQGETEQSLVAALQEGRQEMMSLLYDAYAPVMMGVISRIVPDKEAAEEVLQETFVAIWSRIGIYDASNNRFLSWGLAIARGMALEALKNGKCAAVAKQQGMINFAGTARPASKHSEAKGQADKLFCHLAPQEKAILELIYLKGHSCTEAAAALGIAEETVRTGLKKAFVHIKKEKSA